MNTFQTRSYFSNKRSHALIAIEMFVLLLSGLLISANAWARSPAPVIEGTSVPGSTNPNSVEQRLKIVERRLDNLGLGDMLNRLTTLEQQIQQVVGNMETQAHNVDEMKKRQRDLYLDIDRRLQQVEKEVEKLKAARAQGGGMAQNSGSGAPLGDAGAQGSAAAPSGGSIVNQKLDREAYQRAFNLLKQGRYRLAIASFKAFLETYPNAEYADNAQYWLGEANYVQKNYKDALKEYQTVLDKYPKSNKRADALLKMGFTYEYMNDIPNAKRMLNKVIKNFPDSSAAQLASKRLKTLNSSR